MSTTYYPRYGNGVTIAVDPQGGTSYSAIGQIMDQIKGPTAKASTESFAFFGDVWEQKVKTSVDPGKYTFRIGYDPELTSAHTLAPWLAQTCPIPKWKVTIPQGCVSGTNPTTAKDIIFSAHLCEMSGEMPRKNIITCDIELDVTGDPGYPTS